MSTTTAIFKPVENARPANAAFTPARLPYASRDRGVTFKSGRSVAAAQEPRGSMPATEPELAETSIPDSASHLATEATSPPATDPAPSPAIDQDMIAQTRAEAYAAGLAAARADAMAELQAARDGFIAAHAALSQTPARMESLIAEIEQSVLRLASERAGLAIDSTPLPFLRRIEQLASTISETVADISVMLNPLDLNAIAPHLQDSACQSFRFQADSSLQRGDAKLALPTVTLSDLLTEAST